MALVANSQVVSGEGSSEFVLIVIGLLLHEERVVARRSGAVDRIMMPGDPERRARAARAEAVPIDSGTLAQLDDAARQVAGRFGQSPGPLSALERGC